jgi:large subunit ribosomal protein L22
MRLVVDLVRGKAVAQALNILKFDSHAASKHIEKLLLSAIANWQLKNESVRLEDANLYIKEIFADGGAMLKRLRPAPQGRGHRIRKRSNHLTLTLDSRPVRNVAAKTEENVTAQGNTPNKEGEKQAGTQDSKSGKKSGKKTSQSNPSKN